MGRSEAAANRPADGIERIGRALLGVSRATIALAVFSLLTIWWHGWALALVVTGVWGVGLYRLWRNSALRPRSLQIIKHGLALLLISAVLFITAQATQTIYLANLFVLDVHDLVQPWIIANLPIDGSILLGPESNLKEAWTRNKLPEVKKLKVIEWGEVSSPPIAQDAAQDRVAYFLMSSDDRLRYQAMPSLMSLIDGFTLVKTLPYPQNGGEPVFYIYRIAPPQQSVNLNFGEQIALVGYDLSGADHLAPGQTLHIRPYWRRIGEPATNYSMFIHLLAEGSDEPIAQFDSAPTTETQLTLTWNDPDELYVGSTATLTVPATLKPGRYYLAIGLYDFASGKRLSSTDGSTAFRIPVTVGA